MPKSKTKKMRQWAAQKGKRGKIRQRMTIPTRRLTIRRPHRKPQQRQGQIPLQPLQVGPSVKTTQRLLQLSNHHALRGDYTKSAVAFAAATASAAALGVKHPLSTPTPRFLQNTIIYQDLVQISSLDTLIGRHTHKIVESQNFQERQGEKMRVILKK